VFDDIKLTAFKILIVCIPSYLIAFTTNKITLVVPTVALFMYVASALKRTPASNRNRVDEETGSDSSDMSDASTGA